MTAKKKIETLSVEQQALLPQVAAHWISTGLSTDRADRGAAERGVRLAYEAAGLAAPRFMIWVDSPYAGVFAQAIAPHVIAKAMATTSPTQVRDQVRAQVWDQVWDQVRAQVRAQVWDQVRAQVRDQVWDQVRAQVRAQVGDQVGDQVWDQVGAQVGAQVRAQVWDQVGAQVGDQVWDQVRAQVRAQVGDQVGDQVWDQVGAWSRGLIDSYYSVYWSSWFDAMQQLGVSGLSPWAGQQVVARNAFWWWAFRGFAVLSERPTSINRDTQGRLHSETSTAIEWADGWGFHAWHGTRLTTSPAAIKAMPLEDILRERNAEVRRCMIEIVGWDQLTSQLTLIAECADPGNDGQRLGLYDLPPALADMYDAEARILLATNGSLERDGTRRRFGLPVPAKHTDPVAAAADLYGWPVAAYRQLEVRR